MLKIWQVSIKQAESSTQKPNRNISDKELKKINV